MRKQKDRRSVEITGSNNRTIIIEAGAFRGTVTMVFVVIVVLVTAVRCPDALGDIIKWVIRVTCGN